MTPQFKSRLERIDQNVAGRMYRLGVPALRISFGIIFFWFGVLKPLGYSAAEPLLKATVAWLPFWEPGTWLNLIGWWEMVIGVMFLFKQTTRIAIPLLFLQMLGTFMPLVFLPDVVYQSGYSVHLPTMEGQYIIKNLMIISAALVVGGTFYKNGASG